MSARRKTTCAIAAMFALLFGSLVPAIWADPETPLPPSEATSKGALDGIANELRKIHAALQIIDIAIWLAVAVAAMATLSAYAVVALPNFTRHARVRREESPRLALVLGSLNVLGLSVLCGLLDGGGHAKAAAVLVFVALTFLLFAGAHVSAGSIGRRVLEDLDRPASGCVEQAFGMLVLCVQALLPVVGWVCFAYHVAAGVGATILAIARRSPRGNAPAAEGT